jgi:hypothetical protein
MRSKSATLIALAIAVCGCTADNEAAVPQEESVRGGSAAIAPAGGVRLALLEPSEDSDASALEGYLHVEGPCLYVTGRRGGGPRTHPAFLIRDALWDAEQGVLVAHGRRYRPGQRVRLGGSTASDPRLLRWRQPPDPSCDNASPFVTGMIELLPDDSGR